MCYLFTRGNRSFTFWWSEWNTVNAWAFAYLPLLLTYLDQIRITRKLRCRLLMEKGSQSSNRRENDSFWRAIYFHGPGQSSTYRWNKNITHLPLQRWGLGRLWDHLGILLQLRLLSNLERPLNAWFSFEASKTDPWHLLPDESSANSQEDWGSSGRKIVAVEKKKKLLQL